MINLDDAVTDCRVAVIDLDPKQGKRFAKWEALDREIVAEFSPDESKAKCVDSLAPSQS
jgi:hypothetical protein